MNRRAFASVSAAAAAYPMRVFAQNATPLKVGCVAIEPQAQAYYALDSGIFHRSGITAEITMMRNGATLAAAVAGGDLHVGCINVISLAQAVGRGVPFVAVVPASIYDASAPTGYVITAPDSPIRSGRDLNGKTVAGSTIGGLDQLILWTYIDRTGGDSATVKFAEMPQSATAEAVVTGRIAAAELSEPEFSAVRDRVRVIGDGQEMIAKTYVQTAWFATRDWLGRNADVARRFGDAIIAAGEWAQANPDAAVGVLQKRFGFKEDKPRQRFARSRDLLAVQVLLDAAIKYKLMPKLNAADLFWSARTG